MSPTLLYNMIKKITVLHKTYKYAIIPSRKMEVITEELVQTSTCIIQNTRK